VEPAVPSEASGHVVPSEASGQSETDHSLTPWVTVRSRTVYENAWISVREDDVALPDGRSTIYGVVTAGECVGMLPFVDDDHVLLVRQYRYVFGHPTWEMPTGGLHDGETREAAIQRELAEEAGFRAGRLHALGSFHTSKSVMWEIAHVYAVAGLTPVDVPPDDTEFIVRKVFPFADVTRMVDAGEILDSMTVVAVLQADRRRRDGWRA
jgi:ADP-ribose pyrophosphatase